jgi:hypothetical protein
MMPGKDVARMTGRTVQAVGDRRRLFGIPLFLGKGRKLKPRPAAQKAAPCLPHAHTCLPMRRNSWNRSPKSTVPVP